MKAVRRLLDAPHRVFFFGAAVQILMVSTWWVITLACRASGAALELPAGLEPARVHAFLMIYGFFPLFIFGFLYTAGPRWLACAAPKRAAYAAPAILAVASAWLMLPAIHAGAGAAAAVLLVTLFAWTWLIAQFVGWIVASPAEDRLHPITVACALAVGLAGVTAARLWLITGSPVAARFMEAAGLWGFLVPLFATVSHRMIPFFTASVAPYVMPWRPGWTLAILAGGAVVHGALAAAGLGAWTWIVDAPAGALAVYLAWRWGFARSFSNRMLAMLHVGFAWMGAAWLLHALQSALLLAGVHALGLAPVHALTTGFLTSLALALVSRVSRGHSGHTVAADRLTWVVFLVLQAAALARVSADIFLTAYGSLLLLAAGLWLACFAAWTWRYLPYYWRARADGRPG
ncbi:MAG: NnrS family protein [Usitatibacter sp.]